MAARFLWTSLWVCTVCACGSQALQGGELKDHGDSGLAGEDAALTGGAGGSALPSGGSGGATSPSGTTASATRLPCDIYADDGGPCVAAHSTVRLLLSTYTGPLYQVKKEDGTIKDIGVLAPGGLANAADQDAFCGTNVCTISIIYDQSGRGNHLTKAPRGQAKPTDGNEADANALPITIGGQKVYGEHNPAGVAYRNNTAVGTATGDDPETIYMIASGDYYNLGACCFDYGNVETNNFDNGDGAMEAVNFGICTIWGKGAGSGPWVMGDLSNGLWAGNTISNDNNKTVTYKYVTALVKGDKAGSNHWAIKAGNAQSGNLTSMFDGPRPDRYNPMKKEGAIILGASGDNNNAAQGNFFEGLMTAHYSSDAADDAVQANIVSVYGL